MRRQQQSDLDRLLGFVFMCVLFFAFGPVILFLFLGLFFPIFLTLGLISIVGSIVWNSVKSLTSGNSKSLTEK